MGCSSQTGTGVFLRAVPADNAFYGVSFITRAGNALPAGHPAKLKLDIFLPDTKPPQPGGELHPIC